MAPLTPAVEPLSLAAAAQLSEQVSAVEGLSGEVARWERAKGLRDARLDELAADWASPGPLSLTRVARHTVALGVGQVTWAARRLPGVVRDGLHAYEHPLEFVKKTTAGWLREQISVLGPSAAEVARLAEQSGIWRESNVVPSPAAYDSVRQTLNRAFPGRVASVASVPLAVSYLSQLHKTTLSDGREVLFRVGRPGVRNELMEDIRIAATLLGPTTLLPQLRQARPMAVLRSTAKQAIEHTDLRNDALNAVEMGMLLESYATRGLKITLPVPGFASEEAVAFELPPGAVPLAAAGDRLDAKAALPGLLALIVEAALVDGVFHADLRPEHLMVLEDGSLALVGCSAIGRLPLPMRRAVLDYVTALFSGDYRGQVDAIVRLGAVPDGADLAAMEADLRAVPELAPIKLMTGGEAALSAVGRALISLAMKHELHAPVGILQWVRALLTYRSITRHLVPNMPFVQTLLPLLPRLGEINKKLG